MSNLKALKRSNLSSGSTKKLRADGYIPAILYGGKDSNLNISISKKEISAIISSETFLSKVLEIEVEGKKEKQKLSSPDSNRPFLRRVKGPG